MQSKQRGDIVVAILAVLTAIAVPLFVSQINKAEDAAHKANIDAVRSAATVKILNNNYDTTKTTDYWGDSYKIGGVCVWFVTAEIEDGNIKNLTISDLNKASETVTKLTTVTTAADAEAVFLENFGDGNGWKDKDKGGEVRVVLTETDVSK